MFHRYLLVVCLGVAAATGLVAQQNDATPTDPPSATAPVTPPEQDSRDLPPQQKSAVRPDPPSATASIIPQDEDWRDKILFSSDTERLKPLVTKLSKNVWADQKDIWTSPFRINRHNAVWWLGLGGAAAGLMATDNWTSQQLGNSRDQVRWSGRVSQVGASYTLIPLVAGFYGYGAWRDDPKAREAGILGAEALIDSLIVVQALKFAIRRNRPDEKGPGDFFSSGTSFPSGHAIESWSLASVIAHEYHSYKLVPVLVYGLAATVSASRFAAQKHFASDIVVGAGMGWFIGRYVYQTHRDHSLHHHAWAPQVIPTMDPRTRTYGVALAWGR